MMTVGIGVLSEKETHLPTFFKNRKCYGSTYKQLGYGQN